jgi:hypothetical protein
MKEKKKFKDTKLGQFLKEKVPGVLDVVDDYFPPAKILTALIGKGLPPEDQIAFDKLLQEHEKEMYALEIQDRDSARNREIELAKTGRNDHMMYVSGYTALVSFCVMIYAVIWKSESVSHNPLFHQLMGIIEGVSLTIFAYYFGSSKSSADKTRLMK